MKEKLINYLKDKKFHSSCTSYKHLINIFPKLIKPIKELNYSGQLYCYINNIEYPYCNICNKPKKFISFKKGFVKNCNNNCNKGIINYNGNIYNKVDLNNIKVCDKHNTIITTKKFLTAVDCNVETFCEKCSTEIKSKNLLDLNIALKSKENIKQKNHRKMMGDEYIKTYFPHLYLKVQSIQNITPNIFKYKLNYFLNDIDIKCQTTGCNNVVSFDKLNKPKQYCEKCNRTRETRIQGDKYSKEYWINYIKNNFNVTINDIILNENSLILKDYCSHHKIIEIKKEKLKFLKRKGLYSLCYDCNKEYYKNNINGLNDSIINDNWENIKRCSDETMMSINPYAWGYLNKFAENKCIDLNEAKYMIHYNIKEKPKCFCGETVLFSKEKYGYLDHCEKHLYNNFTSKGEKEIGTYLNSLNVSYIENDRSKIGKELDIFIPQKNIAIEYNGLYYHSEHFRNKTFHYNKMEECKKQNISLINVWEDDWVNKQEIIKSIIKNKLGLSENKIFARKTIIKIVDSNIIRDFLDNNHLQGFAHSHINIGLYYNDELVSLMTFGKKRMVLNSISNDSYEYELIRFCNKLNTSIIGGASKIFKYFIENYNPISIISYANCDISSGDLYETLGFNNIGFTGINYWWFKNAIKYHRSNFMKHKLVKAGFDKNKSETEIMHERGYSRIWGTGNIKYEWCKNKNI